MVSDGHDKPFCTKAITIIDNFKKALSDIDKSQFLKAISIIDKLSPINVAVNFQCVERFFSIFQKKAVHGLCREIKPNKEIIFKNYKS